MKQPLFRLYLRNLRLRVRKDPQKVELIDQVLQDYDLFDSVYNASHDEYEKCARANGAFGGVFIDYVKWLMENREAIFQLMLYFVSLFANQED